MAVLIHKRPISIQISALCHLYQPLLNPLKHLKQSVEVTELNGLHCVVTDMPLKQAYKMGDVAFILHVLEEPI